MEESNKNLLRKEKEYELIKEKTGIAVINNKVINNDRKENEIFILRKENSLLKDIQKITELAGKVENDYSVVDDLTEPLLDVAYIMIDEADNTQVKTREDFIKGIDNLFGSFDWVNEVVLLALNPLSGQLQKNTNQQ